MTSQILQDNERFQTGYLVDGVWKTLPTPFDVLKVVAKVAKTGGKEAEEELEGRLRFNVRQG